MAMILSETIATVVYLLTLSNTSPRVTIDRVLTFQVIYCSVRYICHQLNTIHVALTHNVRRSATARFFRYIPVVPMALTLCSTSNVRMLPRKAKVTMTGQNPRKMIVLSSILGLMLKVSSSFVDIVVVASCTPVKFSWKVTVTCN